MLSWFAFENYLGGQCYVLFDESPERDLEILRLSDDGTLISYFLERPPGTVQAWLTDEHAWRRL